MIRTRTIEEELVLEARIARAQAKLDRVGTGMVKAGNLIVSFAISLMVLGALVWVIALVSVPAFKALIGAI